MHRRRWAWLFRRVVGETPGTSAVQGYSVFSSASKKSRSWPSTPRHGTARQRRRQSWFDWLQRELSRLPLPIAIMAQSDHRTTYLLSACEAAGLAVPEQVALIGVDDVLRASRCGLYRAFHQHIGRAVGEEIDRQRVEHAKKLVRETRHKLHVIAPLSGLSGAEHLFRGRSAASPVLRPPRTAGGCGRSARRRDAAMIRNVKNLIRNDTSGQRLFVDRAVRHRYDYTGRQTEGQATMKLKSTVRMSQFVGFWLASLVAGAAPATGQEAAGNVDGTLTWELGALEPGQAARETVLFVMGANYEEAHGRLSSAREQFAPSTDPDPTADRETEPGETVWIRNAFTDFALQGPGHFSREGSRQSFKGAVGGQLSQFGWYVHYDGERRAGTPILSRAPENLQVIEPLGRVSPEEARVTLETSDRALRVDLRARMGNGPVVGVEFVVRNIGVEPVRDLRLTVYSNLEAAHTHMTDYAVLDRETGALWVIDMPTRFHLAMAGLGRPGRGHAGTWPSQAQLQSAAGVPIEQWTPLEQSQRMLDRLAEAGLPLEQWIAFERDGHLLADLLLEYRPLTESQWARQTPEEIVRWREAEAIAERLRVTADRGTEAQFTSEWIDLMIEANKRIQFRPVIHERVAPYVRPHTPTTQTRSAAEAAELLRHDWLYQVGENPTPERIRDEIDRARELIERIASNYPGQVHFEAQTAVLEALEAEAAGLSGADPTLYLRVREVKRSIVLANPVLDFDSLVFIDRPYPQGSGWRHETRHRLGYMSVPGGRLLVLDGLGPDGALRQLMPQPPLHGNFWRFDLSFDASRVLFCFMPHNEKSFHLYEVGIDGSGLKQLTDSPYDDLDPVYLPGDQHILFTTTRGHTYVRCMPPTNAFILARADRDGRNIHLISANMEPDYLPSVMHDGRVLYSRWEYTDKPLWRAVGLWAVNPDGTQVNTVWGNQSVWPDLFKDARAIPGSRRIMFTGSAHHNWFAGSVGIIDPQRGFNFPHGLTKVTADVPWPESGDGPVDPVESPRYPRVDRPDFDPRRSPYTPDGPYRAYYSPYPLSDQDFLVSANRNGKFVLYLMDVDGNRELIYEGEHHIFYAVPLRPRPEPPVIHDRVAWPTHEERFHPEDGVIYSRDVYHGAPPELHGRARYLRVLNIDPKTYTYWYKRPYISTGPVISAVQSDGVKRILGTVPVEEDGSVAFYAPSGVALHFQLLDERGRALQTMPSFANVMPGEHRGCLGCHESHSATPHLDISSFALARKPQQITPPPWGDETVSFPRFVQPVLDKHCAACHQGEGKAREIVDFTDRPGFQIFSAPYMLLTGNPTWGRPYQAPENPPPGFGYADMLMIEGYDQRDPEGYSTPPPMTALSYRSRLIELVSSGEHHGVKLDGEELERMIAWVDTMAPYRGLEEVREIDDPEFQGIDWLSIRPRVKTAPTIIRPGPVD
ncbi:MAG: hypothetical protein EA424_07130 [Planctomycetaceae bacterium]|nr:MAG: hypothetical protein EA424_07130 [Planctomycetaceae bacterium]